MADNEMGPEPDGLLPNFVSVIGQVFAGVTVPSAARANGCTVEQLTIALGFAEAQAIEAASEWDSVDLLGAEFRETPDILDGIVPVGVTICAAAPKVGKTRLLTQLSVAAFRGEPILGRRTTQTKVLTLAPRGRRPPLSKSAGQSGGEQVAATRATD